MRRYRHTKILATLGPASSSREQIAALFDAGADVFRMNFSHGDHASHRAVYEAIRAVEEDTGRPIGVLADLQGPKLRLGTFAKGRIHLAAGDPFRLDLTDQPGNERRAPLPHAEIFEALVHGAELLLDDGRVRLRVESCGRGYADTRVVAGGWLSDRKGVNLPNVRLPISALTEKDREDLSFALDLGVDWVALSFVQRPEDLIEARELTQRRVGLMAKLEKPSAIEQLEAVVMQADAVMVARGDLGVEMQPEDVPVLQSQIVDICRGAGKPVVVATQMLDSMVSAPTPTRAEASDVATAVYQGADAVMLSAESAVGEYPVEAVAMMDRIIKRVQRDPKYRNVIDAYTPPPRAMEADAVTTGARQMAETLSAALIVTYSNSGSTAFRAARRRPATPLLALTPSVRTARRLSIVWGVEALVVDHFDSSDEMAAAASSRALSEGYARSGEAIVMTAGFPLGTSGTTNGLRIIRVP
ncbi:MAG: pyruvate kinase [Rhodospirillaceae bacterium]|nr:pyruvate kinase [Rhodospirillaceae bacterium]